MQLQIIINVLSNQIPKLFVSSKFYGCLFAKQFLYLLVGKRLILFWNIYTTEPQDFFQHVFIA